MKQKACMFLVLAILYVGLGAYVVEGSKSQVTNRVMQIEEALNNEN